MASETHINAYYADVEDAKAELQAAKSKLGRAERRLEERKAQLGLSDESEVVVEPQIEDEPTKEPEALESEDKPARKVRGGR